MSDDGCDMENMIRNARNDTSHKGDYLILFQDEYGVKFGGLLAVAGTGLGYSSEKYYGGHETAVFSFLDDEFKVFTTILKPSTSALSWLFVMFIFLVAEQYFKSQGKNNYFVLSSVDMLALGGGGNFAIHMV